MAGALTPLAVSVLALLAERAMHPYEMYQLLLDRHEDELVKVRPGSLYHTVERLDGLGHVRACGTERSGNRPERTTYEITSTGRAALRWRLLEMLNAPVNEYPEFPVALSEVPQPAGRPGRQPAHRPPAGPRRRARPAHRPHRAGPC